MTEGTNVLPIDASDGQLGAAIGMGRAPVSLALDPTDGELYVADFYAFPTNLTVIDAATDRVASSIPVGVSSDGIAFDSDNGCLYVVNFQGNVTVVNGSTGAVVAVVSTEGAPTASVARGPLAKPEVEIGIVLGLIGVILAAVWRARRHGARPNPTPASARTHPEPFDATGGSTRTK